MAQEDVMTREQMNLIDVNRLKQHIANVRSWHENPPKHDCPSRTYNELADAVERLLEDCVPEALEPEG